MAKKSKQFENEASAVSSYNKDIRQKVNQNTLKVGSYVISKDNTKVLHSAFEFVRTMAGGDDISLCCFGDSTAPLADLARCWRPFTMPFLGEILNVKFIGDSYGFCNPDGKYIFCTDTKDNGYVFSVFDVRVVYPDNPREETSDKTIPQPKPMDGHKLADMMNIMLQPKPAKEETPVEPSTEKSTAPVESLPSVNGTQAVDKSGDPVIGLSLSLYKKIKEAGLTPKLESILDDTFLGINTPEITKLLGERNG